MTEAQDVVHASGGIVVRSGQGGDPEVALVHRPSYDDWTFPKGKRAEGEDDRQTALREVEEETGLQCRIERPLGRIGYRDRKDRPKTVMYWLMTPLGGSFRATSEVDQILWLPIEQAEDALTYRHDRNLLRIAAERLGGEHGSNGAEEMPGGYSENL
jgi:8-oxo-dGTP pyrophosphatase MutT (NUDIX family)